MSRQIPPMIGILVFSACLATAGPVSAQPQRGADNLTQVEPGTLEPPGPDISTSLEVEPVCTASRSHVLQVGWGIEHVDPPFAIDVTAVLPGGASIAHHDQSAMGRATLELDATEGGTAVVLFSVTSPNGPLVTRRRTAILPSCESTRPRVPAIGFGAGQSGVVPDGSGRILGTPSAPADPNETDIAHIRGTPQFGLPLFVAAAGAGGSARLLSYTLQSGSPVPVLLSATDPIAGADIKLHVLKPEDTPNLGNPLLISAIRRDGNLWLTSWQAQDDGSLTELHTRGYGANADVRVQAYAIAHRSGGDDVRVQVVTPLRTQNNRLRVITWSVSPDGTINGLHDSGDWGDPASDSEVTIARNQGLGFVIGYRTASGDLSSNLWSLAQNGFPNLYGGGASGLDIRGIAPIAEPISNVAAMPLNEAGFVTALLRPGGAAAGGPFGVQLHIWEPRVVACDGGCWSMPYAITNSMLDQRPDLFGIEIAPEPTPTATGPNLGVRALLTDGLVEPEFGVGSGRLFEQLPANELTSVHMASVTKNMTLLLAVEAIESGSASLNDPVTISAAAASLVGPNSSNIGLVTDETQSFRTLLHGMMLRSGNDAAAAIAEHVAGTTSDFVDLMNARAGQLGLSNTLFGQSQGGNGGPAGGGISTPQDQVTLWLFARELPLFRQIARTRIYFDCGTDGQGNQKCHDLVKFPDSGYPSLEGWKGGNGGFGVPGYSGPFCTGGCLVAEALRLGRPMVVGIQNSAQRWNDADEMFDYGFRLQYTPDHMADSGNQGGIASDFGLDVVTDHVAVTAQIESSKLKVCQWEVVTHVGQITKLGCHTPSVSGLSSGPGATATQVDGQRLSRLLFEGDYLTGHLHNNLLKLHAWRLGPREP